MANAILNYKDIIGEDDSFKEIFKRIGELEGFILKTKNNISGALDIVSPKDTKQITTLIAKVEKLKQSEKDLSDIVKGAKKAKKESADLTKAEANAEKALVQTKAEKVKLQKHETDLIIKNNKEKDRQLALSKKQALATEKQALKLKALQQPYKKLSDRLLVATKAYQNVAAAEGIASTKAIKYKKALDRLDVRLKTIDANAGRFQRNVGNYAKGMQSLSNIAIAGGATLGVAGVFKLFKEGIGTMREFEQANANLASVLGKTRQEIKPLTDSAKVLGSETEWSATQVTSLQDAYSRLGFSQNEILNSQAATLQGATALQADLGATAELTGGTLRAYGEDATQAQRYTDVLAKSTSTTALNFAKLSTALPIVGKTADVAGVSFERTAAQLGVLSNNNIDASSSGTALRNIYIELSNKGLTYEQAMNKIRNSTDKLKTANDLFGKKSATVALTLADSTEKVNELEEAYNNAGGTAKKMADEQLKTLEGSIKLLKSAWEGFILSLNEGDNVTEKLAIAIKWLSENLVDVLKAVWSLIKVFAVYKTTMFAIAKAQKIAAIATAIYTKATTRATTATKLFNKANKGTILGVIITLLYAAYEAFQFFSSGAEDATKKSDDYNESLEEGNDLLKERKFIAIEELFLQEGINLNNLVKSHEKLNNVLKSRFGFDKDALELLKERIELRKAELIQNKLEADEQIPKLGEVIQTLNGKRKATVEDIRRSRESNKKAFDEEIVQNNKFLSIINERLKKSENANSSIKETTGLIEKQTKKISDLQKQIKEAKDEDQIISLNIKLQKAQKELQRLNNLYRFSAEERLKIETDLITNQTAKSIELEKQKAKKIIEQINSNVAISTEQKEKLVDKENAVLNKKIKEIQIAEEERVFKIKFEYEQSVRDLELDRTQTQIEEIEEAIEKSTKLNNAAEFDNLKQLEGNKYNLKKKSLQDQYRAELDFFDKRAAAELLLLEKGSDEYKKKQKENSDERKKIKNEEIRELESLDKGYQKTLSDNDKQREQDRIENWKEFYDSYKQVLDLVVDKLAEVYEKQLTLSKENLTKQEAQVEKQRVRAEEGKANTLLFEQKELAKREKQIIASEKRLERIRKAKALYTSYNANLQKKDTTSGQALAAALRDFGIIEAISKGFKDGGYTGDGGISEVAGVTHGKEFVLDAPTTKGLGLKGKSMSYAREKLLNSSNPYMNTKQIALTGLKLADQKDRFIKETNSNINILGLDELKNEFRELKEWQMSVPIQKVDVQKITSDILDFVSETREGNMTKRQTYRVHKKRI